MDGLDTSIPVPDAKCQRALTKFDIALNVVSIILMVALSFLQKRKFLKMDICHGRPGVIYPVNLLDDRTCRFTYAAAFGLASASIFKYLVGEGDPFGVKDVPSYLKALWLIVVVTFTGSAYYPLFVSITLESVVTYIIGTIYSWIFLIRTILDVFLCNKESETSGVMTAAQLPVLTCALYLSIRFPIVLVKYILQYRHTRDMEIDVSSVLHFS
ncbi:receptor for retinol uptake stra6-like [Saccoglossus kowalevskii]